MAELTGATPDEDIFDSIVMAEERFHDKGFTEGFAAGKIAGDQEGFKMGQVKGTQIGSEYGFYLGFVATWLQLVKEDPGLAKKNIVKTLDALNAMLASFKVNDLNNESYWDDLKKIRDKFKQVLQYPARATASDVILSEVATKNGTKFRVPSGLSVQEQ